MLIYKNPFPKAPSKSDQQCKICKNFVPYELVSSIMINSDLENVCGVCALSVLKKKNFENDTYADSLFRKTYFFLNPNPVPVLSKLEQAREDKRIARNLKRKKKKKKEEVTI